MAYPAQVKNQARKLRSQGYSIKEITQKLGIAKSTSSLWVRDIKLDSQAKRRLKQKQVYNQYQTSLILKRKHHLQEIRRRQKAKQILNRIPQTKSFSRLACALLFWAEGSKTTSHLGFTNSDPQMIKTFLSLLRNTFSLDKNKFRAMLHLHEYHYPQKIKQYWSDLTHIPLSQFSKSYHKPHTKIRRRPNYKGCIRIHYYDAQIAKELYSIYNVYASENLGPW